MPQAEQQNILIKVKVTHPTIITSISIKNSPVRGGPAKSDVAVGGKNSHQSIHPQLYEAMLLAERLHKKIFILKNKDTGKLLVGPIKESPTA